MSRQTSVEAYKQIVGSGLVGRSHQIIYDILFNHGPLTGGEIFAKGQSLNIGGHTVVKGSVCARLTEMREMGIVSELPERVCTLTNKSAIVWDVTANNPTKIPRKITKEQQIAEVRKTLLDIHWRIKNNVTIDLPTFEVESKRLLELLRTGIDTKESV